MKLNKIIIDDYNSIKDPQTIDLNGGIITFLGKNGSGKSNLLRALRMFFTSDDFLGQQKEASYHAQLELSPSELLELNPGLVHQDDSSYVNVAFNLQQANLKSVESSAAIDAIHHLFSTIEKLNAVLQSDLQQYNIQLHDLKHNQTKLRLPIDEVLYQQQVDKIREIQTYLINDVEKVKDYLAVTLKDNRIIFNSNIMFELDTNRYYGSMKWETNPKHKTNDDFFKFIKRSNAILNPLMNKIDANLSSFTKQIRQLEFILNRYHYEGEKNSRTIQRKNYGFLYWIQKTINRRCFYLDNEFSLSFQSSQQKDLSYQGFKPRYSLIMESFYHYLIERKVIHPNGDSFSLANYSPSQQEKLKEHFTTFINDSLPKFDVDMIETIQVIIEKGEFKLKVIEKSGDVVDFDDTSLGRRWYFTYLFIKKVLKRGDVFILDGPAAFLHPEAQKTILRELEELAQIGIIILMTTHSPYMISHNQSSIYFVSMTSHGSVIEKGDTRNYALLKDTIGEVGFNNLLLNLTKQYIIVEGPGDLACIKTFIRIFKLDESQYEVWYLEGAYNIRRIKRFLEINHVNSVHLLDYDMKKNYQSEKEGIIFVGEGTKEKSIEGLFTGKDRQRYFKKNKLAHEKIVTATKENLEMETLNNFAKLFKTMGLIHYDLDVS